MTRPLSVGMIGVGDITSLHLPAYLNFADASLSAICDVQEPLLRRRQEEWKIERAYADYHSLLRQPDINLIEVNTPHHLHPQMVLAALEAGKHVACQKPIATRIRDAEAMVEAARNATGRFRVFENFIYYPAYQKAKELLEAGEIGEPLSIRFRLGTSFFGGRWIPLRTELWHLMESERGMGQAVFDDGYHKLSLAQFFFGPVEAVGGFIDRSFIYADMPGQLHWRYQNSAVLGSMELVLYPNLHVQSRYFSADERVTLIGSEGMLEMSGCTGRLMDEPALVLHRKGCRTLFDDLETDWQASFIAGIRDFPRAILEGRPCPLTGEQALSILRFAYALILSAHLQTEVCPMQVTDAWLEDALPGFSRMESPRTDSPTVGREGGA